MTIELVCPYCPFRFSASHLAPAALILDRMIEDGPWFALGNGNTFKDMVFTALITRGAIRCPECHENVIVHEESECGATGDLLACY